MKHRMNLQHRKVEARGGGIFSGEPHGLVSAGAPFLLMSREGEGACWGVVWRSRRPACCRLSPWLAPFLAQSWAPGNCHGESDPQWDSGLFVGCGRGLDPQSAGIPLPRGCARRHLDPQPGLWLGQEPGHHLVCQIPDPPEGQLEFWTLF